jgi:hypothetical protein
MMTETLRMGKQSAHQILIINIVVGQVSVASRQTHRLSLALVTMKKILTQDTDISGRPSSLPCRFGSM